MKSDIITLSSCLAILMAGETAVSVEEFSPPRCEVLPLPDHQVSFRIDGEEKLKWHFGPQYPRPFFYPFNGPSGVSLTRMGHPGAQNHDHHRSVWFAHQKLGGTDFWSDLSGSRIRQVHWYAYQDGDEEAIMSCLLSWQDAEGNELMQQDVVAAIRPLPEREFALELQLTFRPPKHAASVMLEKTNFGLLAVRVSRSLSAFFGGGELTSSEGQVGESRIFGQRARWMDYSGPVSAGCNQSRQVVREGISFFDHPDNPRYPTRWHVREDGWMGASFGMDESWQIDQQNPLLLRYLLHSHAGDYDAETADAVHTAFAAREGFVIRAATSEERHRQFLVHRASDVAASRGR
ncbi:MAG: PmoA family protein [Fuerstiella sp.]